MIFVFLAVCCSGCSSGSEVGDKTTDLQTTEAWFEDVTEKAGLQFQHIRAQTTRYWFPEIMSGGVAWLDYDNDGNLDAYFIQGGDLDRESQERPGNQLYRNSGDGTFENTTIKAGVGDQSYGMGCTAGDYDNDGDVDIYVTNVGPNRLYRNNGDGTFTNITEQTGVGHDGWGTSAAFVDYDNDGWLDLFVVNYIDWSPAREITCFSGGNERDYCHPSNYNAPATDVLYHNSGDGSFRDVTRSAGIAKAKGNGMGIAHGDFNGDGRMDFYVANDGNPNQLWINNGDGTFSDQGLLSGSAVNRQGMAEAGMGVMAVDIENDGDLDLFMTHLRDETNTLYRHQEGLFEDVTIKTGLSAASIRFTGFGAGFADFDHDGVLDLYVANGRVGKAQKAFTNDPYAEPNQLFQGLRNSRFKEINPQGGTLHTFIENSRATAFGDYDNDGDIDILVINNGGSSRLLKNRVGNRKNWIVFRVINRYGRDAIGANVRITTSAGSQWRQVQTAYSYQSCHDPRVHFGLDKANGVENVLVVWPGGQHEAFGQLPAGAVHLLRAGAGKSVTPGK